ncbi:BMP family lipoprotein [Fluviispira multicolorata]|uniref:BMP family ABC transporter substrate-binding protein n=1 Tax=Fluviispira multicolorata TaxID=2654512 RepID=A0A833JCT2_9BACT|nr:BMP family ABC transporter substrate-binding protein [Fluviispira multicolorata]KAB8030898.1 BMP family ABC transporter substrate-binding protein [Fluviispira multicolorata]
MQLFNFVKNIFLKSFFFSLFAIISLNSYAEINNKICLILDKGGKDDKSFNQSAYEGFLKAQSDFKITKDSKYVTVKEDSQSPHFIRTLSNGDCGLIIAVGFNNADIVGKMAQKFPKQRYVLVDSSIKETNIRSLSFQEHEGSFLIGAIAAIKSKTAKIGFIGGMEIPLIKRFALGFESGAKYINPKIKITETYVGVSPAAWNNPTKAKELALSMYNQESDIIFVAAGASSQGVFDAVSDMNKKNNKAETKKFVIGVDSNQNYLIPGTVLTSMEKKVNSKIYSAVKDFIENKFTTGVITCGFADDGVDWAYDTYNKQLFSNEDIKKINKIKQDIISKKINVPDYYKVGK